VTFPVVFDATALVELFNSHPVAMKYWLDAENGLLSVVFPATAIAEANASLKATFNEWQSLLWEDVISVAPLNESSAVEAGLQHRHDMATSHVTLEAQQIRGVVLTSVPANYAGGPVPVLII
jgi:hypothetical protein